MICLAEVQNYMPMAGEFHLCITDQTNNLPPRCEHTDILHVQFHGTGKNNYTVNYEKVDCTLLTKFLEKCSEKDFHEMLMKLSFNIKRAQDVKELCERVLERGIYWNQRLYVFLGHSEAQLRRKSCFFMNASHEEIHGLLAQFGDFLEEQNIGKRAGKIGMLFSPLKQTHSLDPAQCRFEQDIKRGFFRSYTFTDGCGFMSREFSLEVQKTLKLDYHPSTVQVRYRGTEGLLVLKEDLTEIKVQFHESMRKFATLEQNMPESLHFLDLLDYSRPYENGYLGNQMIMLLAERGVPLQNLEKLQSGYFELLEGICNETAEYFLRFKGELGLLEEIKTRGIDAQMKRRLKSLRSKELDENKKAPGQTRILVPQSRVVFAVCDPYNKLKYGECYFNPTMSDDEAKSFPGVDKKFVVARSPCYHPGDVRVLRLTDDKQSYENLRDCLVMPVKGPRPQAFECAGGTLGGDKFFISWNKNIIPRAVEKPCAYPLKKLSGMRKAMSHITSFVLWSRQISPQKRNERARQEMQQYFVNFDDDLAQRIDATYVEYAAVFGPSSKECRKLCKMFYQVVNLMEDRAAMEKEFLKLEKRGLRLKSSVALSAPAPSETTHLLTNEERAHVEHSLPEQTFRLSRLMRRSRRHNYGHEARKKIEVKAEEYVKRVQREFQKCVV